MRYKVHSNVHQGALLVAISAISFGFLPIFAKFVYASGMDVFSMLFLRFSLGSFFLLLTLRIRNMLNIPPRRILLDLALLGGIGYFLQSIFYLSSIRYIPASVAVLLLYTFPPIVAVMSYAMHIDVITRKSVVAIIIGFIGLFLVANPSYNLNLLGILLALGASFVYSNYIVFSSKTLKEIQGELGSLFVMAFASLSFFIISMFNGFHFNFYGFIWSCIMALVSTAIAITTFFMGLRLIGPTNTSIISLLEPVTTIVLSFLIFYESLNLMQDIGAIFIILAAGIISIKNKKSNSRYVR
ncbi:MAG TPA: DMT family transporter [Geobacterales bacterium]|nr:DMT family transporter [Geobacterales bacterium]